VPRKLDEIGFLLDVDEQDWEFLREHSSRGDARLIGPQPAPDEELYGYRSLAYESLRHAFLEVQTLARTQGYDAVPPHLTLLAHSPWLQAMAAMLGQDLRALCQMVARRLRAGKTLVFESLDNGSEQSVLDHKRRKAKSRKVAA